MGKHEEIKKQFRDKYFINCDTEVSNHFGRADVVTSTEIIEISNSKTYREAIGRLISYNCDEALIKLIPRLHLFACEDETFAAFENVLKDASVICDKHVIRLSFQVNEKFYYFLNFPG